MATGYLDAFDVGTNDVVDLATGEGRGLGLFGADESGHARRGADHVEDLGVGLAANEEVAREHALGDGDLFARLELGDVLFGQVDLVDRLAQLAALDDVVERPDDLLLVSREGVHDVPTTGPVEGALDNGLFVLVDDRDVEDLLAVKRCRLRLCGFLRRSLHAYFVKRNDTKWEQPSPSPKISAVMKIRTKRTMEV